MIKQTTITIICMLCIIGAANAATFGVETTICAASWYCTAYSEGSCGARTCVDVNVCGTNIDKPTEFLQCNELPSGGGGTGGGGSITGDLRPNGYFTTDTDIISMTIKQNTVTQKIIIINTTMPGEYFLEIQYPSSYTKGTDFMTTSNNNKSIEYKGDFSIIIDTRSILVGTYVIPIKISNKYYSKTIETTIDVIPENSISIELYVDSKIKQIGIDKDITSNVKIKGIKLWAGENITYTLLDPIGNVLQTEDRIIIDPSNIVETIALPENIGEGYYTLAIKFKAEENEYSKSTVFTVFAPNKYMPIIEKPQQISALRKNIVWIIVVAVIAALMILNALTADKPNRRNVGRTWSRRLMMSRPLINISFSTREKIRNLADKFKIRKDMDEKHQLELVRKKNEILRKSYEKGFISLTEYTNAIHSQGPPSEQEREHIRKEEERHKREAAERKEEEKREKEKKEAEEQKEEKRKEEEKQRIEEEHQKQEHKKQEEEKKEKEKKEIEERKEKEEKLVKILEKREEKLIEKIVEKMDREEDKKEEEHRKEEKREEHSDEAEKKHEYHTENDSKTTINIMKRSDVLDRRVRDHEAFVLNNNELLYSLRDLLNVLPHMPEHILHHHIKHGRNDFANWIADVFHYEDIAKEVRNADSREELITILQKHQ